MAPVVGELCDPDNAPPAGRQVSCDKSALDLVTDSDGGRQMQAPSAVDSTSGMVSVIAKSLRDRRQYKGKSDIVCPGAHFGYENEKELDLVSYF